MALYAAPSRTVCCSVLWAEGRLGRCRSIVHRCNGYLLGYLWLEALPQLTMTSTTDAPLKTAGIYTERDPEIELIDRLVDGVRRAGFRTDRTDVANFYVALKHRPLAVLAGPPETGKAALVECLAHLLAANNLQKQVVQGHAWYAGGKPASTVLIGMHTRMVTEKLLFAMEEASHSENTQQVFIVGLTHISPAELLSFFTEVAYQIRHKQIMRIGDTHLSEPIPFPPNLLLIGTLDTVNLNSWDDELLSGATIVRWHASQSNPRAEISSQSQNCGYEFMRYSLRDHCRAYKKLLSVTTGVKQPFQIMILLRGIFQTYGLPLPPALFNDVILFLANAWSARGNSLFDPVTSRNLEIAFDLALAQLVLPHSLETIQSSVKLRTQVHSLFREQLPRSNAILSNA